MTYWVFWAKNGFVMLVSSFDLVLTFKSNMAPGGHLENCIFNILVPSVVWLMLCGVFGGKEIIFVVSLLVRLGLDFQTQDNHHVANGLCNFGPTGLPVFMIWGYFGSGNCDLLVVDPCSDHQIKMVVCGYLKKLSLNCFNSHAAPCHMSWWIHFAVCSFGPLNALLHGYLYHTACFPLVICIIYLLPVYMVCHHLYFTTALSIECWNPQQVQLDLVYPLRKEALAITFLFPYSERVTSRYHI